MAKVRERHTVITSDPSKNWEYECHDCHQMRFVPKNTKPTKCGACGSHRITVARPGELPLTVRRFLWMLDDCVCHLGYCFEFVANGNTVSSPNPTDMRSFGAIYWKASTGSLWGPIEVVNMAHFRRQGEPMMMFKNAVSHMGMDRDKARLIHDAAQGCDGYNRNLRRRILKAVDNCQRRFDD